MRVNILHATLRNSQFLKWFVGKGIQPGQMERTADMARRGTAEPKDEGAAQECVMRECGNAITRIEIYLPFFVKNGYNKLIFVPVEVRQKGGTT